jgi:beta-galactosidase
MFPSSRAVRCIACCSVSIFAGPLVLAAPPSGQSADASAQVSSAVGSAYAAPTSPMVTVDEDPGWKFKLNPAGAPASLEYDDSSWQSVSLPHTWNGTDAASTWVKDGNGWYRKVVAPPQAAAGKKLYLRFGAGSSVTSLYIDGAQIDLNPATPEIDSHRGAFQAFVFDVTQAMNAPVPEGMAGHTIVVKTDSDNNLDIPPAKGGDYSRQGGLYRDVSLLEVNPLHIALTEDVAHPGVSNDKPSPIAGSGVRFSHSAVVMGATSTHITVKTVLDNLAAARTVRVDSFLVDHDGIVSAKASAEQAMMASQTGVAVTQDAEVTNPHLWNARIDPYLYHLYVEVRDAATGELLDVGDQQVGIRSFKINANPNPNDADPMNRAAFMLNGQPYRLVGVDAHQDSGRFDSHGHPVGWAQTAEQIRADLELIANMGATAIRTSHYQDSPAFYSGCDQLGIMVYTENSINGSVADTSAYLINAEDQYNELIRQNYNHPSIFAWGFGNETSGSPTLVNIFRQLNTIAHTLDPSRLTGFAQYGGSSSTSTNADGIPDIKGTHPYDYWYGVSDVKGTHKAYPSQPLGVTEYGGGGSAYQYADRFTLPVSKEPGGVRTHYHPANQQTRLEELHYTDLTQLKFLWGQFTWQMFDHASSGKNEGGQGGINDKGLATRDRVLKDSYFFYQASLNDPSRAWNNQHVLYISDRFWTVRNSPSTTVTVFSNIGAPTLTLNGASLGTMSPLVLPSGPNSPVPGTDETIADTYTMDVTLAVGENTLEANCGDSGGQHFHDRAVWSYRNALSGSPLARIAFLPSGVTPPHGYSSDSGELYALHGEQTYGWLPARGSKSSAGSILAPGETFGTASTRSSETGINLGYDPIYKNSSVWEYSLPNGVYDVRIGAGKAGANDGVDMFTLQGKLAAVDSNGVHTPDTFYSRIMVTNNRLTLAAAPGAYNARLNYVDVNRVSDLPPTSSGEQAHDETGRATIP